MKKKRFLCLMVTLVFFFNVFSVSGAFASSSPQIHQVNPKVLFQKDEIKDINELFQRAKNNKSDINIKFNPKATLKDDRGNIKKLATYHTTQWLKKLEYSNGAEENFFATTAFVVVPESTISSKYNDKLDPQTYGVKAYATIYWTNVTDNGTTYWKFTKASGGWQILDGTITISGMHVMLAEYGPSPYGSVSHTKDYYPTSNTFSYTTPSTWEPILPLGYVFDFGVNTWATLRHGSGSPWELHMTNTYQVED